MCASSSPRASLPCSHQPTRDCSRRGARQVIVHGRSAEKVSLVVDELRRSGASGADGYVADLSSCAEVRQLAARVLADHPVLDGLLNNAGTFDGGYTGRRVESVDGNELSLAVNVIAPFLLTSLLLPALRASAHARVLFTSSMSQGSAGALADPQLVEGWSGHAAYAFSKLANVMLAVEMHRRYARPPSLTVNTMVRGARGQRGARSGGQARAGHLDSAHHASARLRLDAARARASAGPGHGGHEDAPVRLVVRRPASRDCNRLALAAHRALARVCERRVLRRAPQVEGERGGVRRRGARRAVAILGGGRGRRVAAGMSLTSGSARSPACAKLLRILTTTPCTCIYVIIEADRADTVRSSVRHAWL